MYCNVSCKNKFYRKAKREKQPPERVCKFCGKKFVPTSPSNTTYCSHGCYMANKKIADVERYQKIRKNTICVVCGKKLGYRKASYCSDECANTVYKKANLKDRVCKFCGKKFIPTMPSNKSYCSHGCYLSHKKIVSRERYQKIRKNTICVVCGKKLGFQRMKFCSDECASEFHKNTGLHGRCCKSCGKEFYPSRHSHKSYCSKECARLGKIEIAKKWREKNGRTKTSQKGPKGATICICPKCGETHAKFMFWTGRGTPRVYCNTCASSQETTTFMQEHIAHRY